MAKFNKLYMAYLVYFFVINCSDQESFEPDPINPQIGVDVVSLPIVIHVIHNGEPTGVGPNISTERIKRQIEILNEDFRRKKGTRGYNDHPDGEDSKIEFVLTKFDPESKPINGINRINATKTKIDNLGYNQNHYAQYAYWDPTRYINIWITPLPAELECLVLGSASGPKTDLPGTERLSLPKEGDAEGILINWIHFGESDISCHAKYGRTLTHEMGHYLGLLHTWDVNNCKLNDYCDDTPAVDQPVFGRTAYIGCLGDTIMIGNYMNYSHDDIMNIFTKDQVDRMHYVLLNHEGRNSLITSPVL